jgi:L-asparagine transporter-like permease
MTELRIIKYYKQLSIFTLAASLTLFFIPSEQEIFENILQAIMLNVMFHIAFQFLSRIPIGMYESMERDNSKLKGLTLKIMKFLSIFFIVMSIFGSISFLISMISKERYEHLIILPVFGVLFLGGYHSKLKLSEK